MSIYAKALTAIVSTLVTRWLAQYFGIDPMALGIEEDLRVLVGLGIDFAIASVNGFWVWLLPNKPKAATK